MVKPSTDPAFISEAQAAALEEAANYNQKPSLPGYGHLIYEDGSYEPIGRQWEQRPMGSQINRSYFDPKARISASRGPNPVANARGPLVSRYNQYPFDPFKPPTIPNNYGTDTPHSWRSGKMVPGIEEDILRELANFMRDPEFVMEGVLKRLQSKNKEKQKQNQTTNI